ncbi:hypothetical protein FIBSPDRAFT_774430 [Athelia psychrophila]|uniref:FYVE-type domain-containing protein n=1 Tax=Athelia psychrophila TaxID=1759441 RepID=A0A166VAI8_9AGAM|nr:hypothetical protein FIBSPDRAFT_774430 [Fibularhizoctonia sp. CBS 109695]
MSSPPANVPYQAYRSKKHSRTSSNAFTPNVSPPPISRITSNASNGYANSAQTTPQQHRPRLSLTPDAMGAYDAEKHANVLGHTRSSSVPQNPSLPLATVSAPPTPEKVETPVSSPTYTRYVPNGGATSPSMSPAPLITAMPTVLKDADAVSVLPSPTSPAESEPQVEVHAPSPVLAHTRSIPSISLTLDADEGSRESSSPSSPQPEPIQGPSATTASTSTITASKTPVSDIPMPSSSNVSSTPPSPIVRKTSSFRHVPLRGTSASGTRSLMPSSPLRTSATLPPAHLRNPSANSMSILGQEAAAQPQRPSTGQTPSRFPSIASVHSQMHSPVDQDRPLPSINVISSHAFPHTQHPAFQPPPRTSSYAIRGESHPLPRTHSLSAPLAPKPPPKPYSPAASPAPPSASSLAPSPAISPAPSQSQSQSQSRPPSTRSTTSGAGAAPYRPGFQPKGVWRPLTDDFMAARTQHLDEGRVERRKLERRLEKLVALHFPKESAKSGSGGGGAPGVGPRVQTPNGAPGERRRTSSFFDMASSFRSMDAGELWRGVLQSQAVQGTKGEIRAAEQRITPWEDDASVAKCPVCTAAFHPLTNRKHHCRLCGQIVCSLPIKRPQRPETCSLLFVVDPKTRRIEEVGEGVDYGVRRRRASSVSSPTGKVNDEATPEEEKFLKGVRICRQCRPILSRQQHHQEIAHVPTFSRLYEAFISLEREIEDSLPQFQELILSLSNEDQPTKEASAARKRLLEAFGQYDALAKRIVKIPCPTGKGSSQDRVQRAILSRANLFLQKNMFPLQSLPKPKTQKPSKSPGGAEAESVQLIDPDSAAAHALQPLLEQEALLESFVEEAKAHRKFEDAKILKTNLGEIRAEIDRVMANAEPPNEGKGKAKSAR